MTTINPKTKAMTELRKGDTFLRGGYTFTVRNVNRIKGHPSTKGNEFVRILTTAHDAPTHARTTVFTATENTVTDSFVKVIN